MTDDHELPAPTSPAAPVDSLSERFQRGLIHRGGQYVIASPTGSWRGGAVGILRPAGPSSEARVWLVIPLELAPTPEWFQRNPLPPSTVLALVAPQLPPPEFAARFEEEAGLPVVVFAPTGQVGGARGGDRDVVDELRRTLAYDDATLTELDLDAAYERLFAAERERAFHRTLFEAVPKIWVTYAVIAACVGIWLAQLASGMSLSDPRALLLLDWGASSGGLTADQPWRLLTAGFLHGGILHLGLNMWMMLVLGRLAERLFGRVGYAAIFLLSVVGGFIASCAWNPSVVAVGASGGIFGIMGAMVGFSARRRGVLPVNVSRRLGVTVGLLVLANLGLSAWLSVGLPIDNAGHIGGVLVGLAAGLALAPALPREDAAGSRGLPAILALALVLAGAFAAVRALPSVSGAQRRWGSGLGALAARTEDAAHRVDRVIQKHAPRESLEAVERDLEAVRQSAAGLKIEDPDLQRLQVAIVDAAEALGEFVRRFDAPSEQTQDRVQESLERLGAARRGG